MYVYIIYIYIYIYIYSEDFLLLQNAYLRSKTKAQIGQDSCNIMKTVIRLINRNVPLDH